MADSYTCGSLWVSATARSGVLSSRYSSADAVLAHRTPLPPVAPAGAWSAGGIESISPIISRPLHALVCDRQQGHPRMRDWV